MRLNPFSAPLDSVPKVSLSNTACVYYKLLMEKW